MRVASIDVGSNTALMLVGEHDGRDWRSIEDHLNMPRLSTGLDASGVLSEASIERTRSIMAQYRIRAAELGVDQIVATGTAPFRRASNGAEAARVLGAALGAPIDVVSGEEEAALSLLATRRSFPTLDRLTVVDIGGASTEITAVVGDETRVAVSLDIGSVRLSERTLDSGAVTAEQRAELIEIVAAALDRDEIEAACGLPMVGIAGTVTTIAAMAMAMAVYDSERIHGHRLGVAQIASVRDAIAARDVESRRSLVGLNPKRADVIAAGGFLLHGVATRLGVSEVIVSDRGTRWGRLYAVL